LEVVKPALSDPSTMNTVTPWYLVGKANLGIWDDAQVRSMTPREVQPTPEEMAAASRALVEAYNAYVKAMPLDQLPDAKGKVKPKHTKEMRKSIGENYRGYLNAGLNLYNVQDYPGAYAAWDLYVNLPNDENADPKAFVADADSTVGEIAYYQALAAFFSKDFENALNKVQKALSLGYEAKNVYLVGLEAADATKNTSASSEFARKGNVKYGADDISFLAGIINSELAKDNYPACYEAIDESFSVAGSDSIKSLLYNVKAIVNEREGKIEDAKANLSESIKLAPQNAKSYFDMGRLLQNEVAAMEDTADDATRLNVLVPKIKDAISYYEKSYELDDTQSSLPQYIYRLYYGLDQNYHLGQEYADKAEYWKNM
ncbi:MAG: hypothetical protein K2L46_06780, partial [Paramuribaculum sp.]|nr:hypothetical protein [Paramuribaculum sp.]